MHTVDLLEEALAAARRLGYEVRMEWLGGSGGGTCQFAGKHWLFIDLALSSQDQLDQAASALIEDRRTGDLAISPPLSKLIGRRLAA